MFGHGGGLAYAKKFIVTRYLAESKAPQDGGANCVHVSMYIKIDGTNNVNSAGTMYPDTRPNAKTLFINTKPQSSITVNNRDEVANQLTDFCVPW